MNEINAIPTPYDGCLFRSRREARWAVFFNTADIPWEYEEQGYDLGAAGWYLPDFRINADTHAEVFFEVKGKTPTREELAKAEALTEQSKLPVYVYFDQVRLPASPSLAEMDNETFWDGLYQQQEREAARAWTADPIAGWPALTFDLHRTWADECKPTAYRALRSRNGGTSSRGLPLWWTDCPHCGLAVPKVYGQVGMCPGLPDNAIPVGADYPVFRHATKRLQEAYNAARAARFSSRGAAA